jgi:hypothetical protein
MQDFGLYDVAWALGSIACVSLIGFLWRYHESIVSIVSSQWRDSVERAREQKAARERLYGYVDYVDDDDPEPVRYSSRTGSEGGSTGSGDLVRGHLYQVEPDSAPVREPVASLRNLTRLEEIALLSVQRNDDGSYRHSANKIVDIMGGTAAEVKAQVATIRATKAAQEDSVPNRLKRPVNGWPS